MIKEFLGLLFHFGLYFVINIVSYFLYPFDHIVERYFTDKVVWITGASSGIGRELAKELVRLCPNVRLVLSARRENELYALAQELQLDSTRYLVLPLDLENHGIGFVSKVNLVLNKFGRIDILINNGGISQRSLIKDTVTKVDVRLINVNYLGTVTLSKAVLQHFIERQRGHYVVVTSAAAYAGTPLRSSYAASKSALHGFFESLRVEHYRDNIDVTMVCPGFVRTEISMNALEGSGSLHRRMDPRTDRGTDPTICARHILHGIAGRKHEIYVGRFSSLAIYLRRFFPALLFQILLRSNSS